MRRVPPVNRGVFTTLVSLAVLGLGRVAVGDTFVIGGFDPTRSTRHFLGEKYDYIRGAIQNPNQLYDPNNLGNSTYSWSTTTSGKYTGVSFKAETDVITAEYLEGVDLLMMTEVSPLGWDPNDPNEQAAGSSPEYEIIADFVRDGGCLVIVAEYCNAGCYTGADQGHRAMSNWTLEALDQSGDFWSGPAGRLTVAVSGHDNVSDDATLFDDGIPSSEVLHGPFPYYSSGPYFDDNSNPYDQNATETDSYLGPTGNPVDPDDPMPKSDRDVRLAASWHRVASVLDDGTSWAQVIGERQVVLNASKRSLIMEIPLGVVSEDAGAVLVVGDTIFQDLFVPGNDDSEMASRYWNVNNGALLLNFVAQQMDMPETPEPSVTVLLVTGAIVGLGLTLRRRRK